jgi:hypothetical protein
MSKKVSIVMQYTCGPFGYENRVHFSYESLETAPNGILSDPKRFSSAFSLAKLEIGTQLFHIELFRIP